ncbi:MAG TPA: hypothetical protein PKZ84_23125 [Anaerolineae bacterium]|nr:hypothetical protein [Anaerolineae bacterium]HQI87433.1 hypothetical protein [Anaerolineae bacterium]
MKKPVLLKYIVVMCVVCLLGLLALQVSARSKEVAPDAPQAALGTAFTYQGQLQDNGTPANGAYDFRFTVYDVLENGSPLAGTTPLTRTAVAVTHGQFTVRLDFGNIFGDQRLYLEIAVRPGGSSDAFTTLTPRQEITPAPYARYAIQAGSATTAQSVPWDGVSGKPAKLNWRSLYIPANAMNYTPGSNLVMAEKGLRWPNTTQLGGFGVKQPDDWDQTTPFTVTLYFALPTATTSGSVRWRLHAGGSQLNLPESSATSGWDQIYYGAVEDAPSLAYWNAEGHFYLMKSQSWVSKWSTTYGAWYFGSSVTTGNDFGDNPMWFFYFERGAAAGNGETYTGEMVVVGAEITYLAKP